MQSNAHSEATIDLCGEMIVEMLKMSPELGVGNTPVIPELWKAEAGWPARPRCEFEGISKRSSETLSQNKTTCQGKHAPVTEEQTNKLTCFLTEHFWNQKKQLQTTNATPAIKGNLATADVDKHVGILSILGEDSIILYGSIFPSKTEFNTQKLHAWFYIWQGCMYKRYHELCIAAFHNNKN